MRSRAFNLLHKALKIAANESNTNLNLKFKKNKIFKAMSRVMLVGACLILGNL
jgi:hypothetical protein